MHHIPYESESLITRLNEVRAHLGDGKSLGLAFQLAEVNVTDLLLEDCFGYLYLFPYLSNDRREQLDAWTNLCAFQGYDVIGNFPGRYVKE